MAEEKADIAVIGLAVMGQNLILRMNDYDIKVCAYNKNTSAVDSFLADGAKGTKIIGAHSLEEMLSKLKKPRKIMFMIRSGKPVDDMIDEMVPLLENGDIIIDGGNSDYLDSNRRVVDLAEKGLLYVGCGVSGGEKGARCGPALMPGGCEEAWPHLKHIFQAVAAKYQGTACCEWIGPEGSGHFAKIIHNGILYGDMQLVAEAYNILKDVLHLSNDEMSQVFDDWNTGELESLIVMITRDVLKYKEADGSYLIDQIRDTAGHKGTGKWASLASIEYGVPVTLIVEGMFARLLSGMKDERVHASQQLKGPTINGNAFQGNKQEFIEDIKKALFAAKIISYTQGFMLMKEVSNKNNWNIKLGNVALIWRAGCIIRSSFLANIKEAFDRDPNLSCLILDEFFRDAIHKCQNSLRKVVATACLQGIPVPAFSAALAFYDGYRTESLPANLIQAQRDYFGAHNYEKKDNPGHWVHTNWSGQGGSIVAEVYNV